MECRKCDHLKNCKHQCMQLLRLAAPVRIAFTWIGVRWRMARNQITRCVAGSLYGSPKKEIEVEKDYQMDF